MEEKRFYTPHEITEMFLKTDELEAALKEGDIRTICQKNDEYRQTVPENVRNVLHLFFGNKYIESRVMKLYR